MIICFQIHSNGNYKYIFEKLGELKKNNQISNYYQIEEPTYELELIISELNNQLQEHGIYLSDDRIETLACKAHKKFRDDISNVDNMVEYLQEEINNTVYDTLKQERII